MPAIEYHHGLLVGWVAGGAGFLVGQQSPLHLGRQVGAQTVGLLDPLNHTGR